MLGRLIPAGTAVVADADVALAVYIVICLAVCIVICLDPVCARGGSGYLPCKA